MISYFDRMAIYTKIFTFYIKNNINFLPISTDYICQLLNVELKRLSELLTEGIAKEDVFKVWGNEDGTVGAWYNDKTGKTIYRIFYNDMKIPTRQRFTIFEELSHIILEHTNIPEFNIFKQSYTDDKYLYLDEEARIAAGLLLCSPKFFYNQNFKNISTNILQYISEQCNISRSCTMTRFKVLTKFKTEIINHPLYDKLPEPSIISESDIFNHKNFNSHICQNEDILEEGIHCQVCGSPIINKYISDTSYVCTCQ